jgi:hypothetical protein
MREESIVKWSPFAAVVGAALFSVAPAVAAPKQPSAPPSNSIYSSSPHVFMVAGSSQSEIPVSMAQQFLASQSRGIFFMPTNITTRMGFFLPQAPAFASPSAAVFEVKIAGVSWADPTRIVPVIIRLQSTKGHEHVIGTQTTNTSVLTSVSTLDPIADDLVPAKVDLIEKPRFRITPSQPLEPGEYAIAIRDPDVKAWSGKMGDPANVIPAQQIFQMYAWAFVVKSGQQ